MRPTDTSAWKSYPLGQLEQFRKSGTLGSADLEGHGVYLLRRRLVPFNQDFRGSQQFCAWLDSVRQRGSGRIEYSFSRHFFRAQLTVDLGLTERLADVAPSGFGDVSGFHARRLFRRCLEGTAGPVLYCGETHLFRARVSQHLDGSEAWSRLTEAGFSARDLDFEYFELAEVDDRNGPDVVAFRRQLEQLVAQATLATLTSRPG